MRGGEQPVHRERLVADRLDGGEHDRQLRARAAGHHRVDRDLLDGRLAAVGRHDADDVLRVARRVLEHRHDALGRRRDDRQAVGERRARAAPRRGPRARRRRARATRMRPSRAGAARGQPRGDLGVARERRAARAHLGQAVEVELRRRPARPGRACRSRCRPSTRPRSSPPSSSTSVGTASGSRRADSVEVVVELGDARAARAARPARRSRRRSDWREHADARRRRAPGSTWSQTGQSCLTRASSSGGHRPGSYLRRLAPAPARRALLAERAHALAHVLRGEARLAQRDQLALDVAGRARPRRAAARG